MKIEDNFLKQEDFDKLHEFMFGSIDSRFYWVFVSRYYQASHPKFAIEAASIDLKGTELDQYAFIHTFYNNHVPMSPYMEHLDCILQKIRPVSIIKIKANLLTRLPYKNESPLHSDLTELSEEQQKQWTTSIFYVNTNDGYTVFEDGTKVESVANRMLTFPANLKHTGTTCTDQQIRIVINFNYYKNG